MSAPAPAPAGGDKPDYLDKAFDAGQKKFAPGKNVNPSTREKITDKIRQIIEKISGKKLPAKVSN